MTTRLVSRLTPHWGFGLVLVWCLVYPLYYFASGHLLFEGEGEVASVAELGVLVCTYLVTAGALVVLLLDIRSRSWSPRRKLAWSAVVLSLHVLAMPIYWALHVRTRRSES